MFLKFCLKGGITAKANRTKTVGSPSLAWVLMMALSVANSTAFWDIIKIIMLALAENFLLNRSHLDIHCPGSMHLPPTHWEVVSLEWRQIFPCPQQTVVSIPAGKQAFQKTTLKSCCVSITHSHLVNTSKRNEVTVDQANKLSHNDLNAQPQHNLLAHKDKENLISKGRHKTFIWTSRTV